MTHQGDEGGSTNSITWLTRGLTERGHDVHLACRPESLLASRFAEGPVRRVDARLPRGPRLLGEARAWKRWTEEHRIDVVNAHASLDRHLVSYLRLLGSRVGIVHTRRNLALSTGGWVRARFDALTTDAVIAVSRRVADDLVRRGLPRRHVTVVRNGIPLDRLAPVDPERVAHLRRELALRDGVPVVGVVARRKSQDDVLRAASVLRRPLEILFVGIDEDPELRALGASLPEECRALCLGFREDVADVYGLFDAFVLPSSIEGFSLALLEAMARGLPCIATDAGGNREALENGAGDLFSEGDATALAGALSRILDDPPRARARGEAARDRVFREFDVARTIEGTEAVYRRVHEERAG